MSIAGLGKGIGLIKKVKNNPIEFFIDQVVAFIVQLFIPIPLAGEIAILFKGPILVMLGTLIFIFLFILITFATLLSNPAFVLQNLSHLLSDTATTNTQVQGLPIDVLKDYLEAGFSDTNIPSRNPFGGEGQNWTGITAYFHDLRYFAQFGMVHTGVDLVPLGVYYENNKAYQETNQVIVFATNNGKANSYTDGYGALTVDITNSDNSIQTEYKHLKQIFLNTGEQVKAGQPVGIMGMTGFATGEHLHYEVRLNEGGSWVQVDPLGYIH